MFSLCIDGLTDIGLRRANNEDAWWAGPLGGPSRFMDSGPAPLQVTGAAGTPPVLLLVSDGVGGANAGEVASQMAVTLIAQELGRAEADLARGGAGRDAILRAMHAADAAIKRKGEDPAFDGMGATLSLLCFAGGDTAWWGQAGDSRIYLCRHGRLRQVSRDHSPVGRMRQEGRITEEEARRHPQRNQIDQSLGDPTNPFQPDVGCEKVQAGDVCLVCSDGVSDGLWDREIEKVLAGVQRPSDVRPAVQQLVAGAKQASGRDNITAIVALVVPAAPGPARRTLWRRILRQ